MEKLILLSIIVAMVAIPSICAKSSSPHRGLVRAIVGTAIFTILYGLVLILFVVKMIDTNPPASVFWLR